MKNLVALLCSFMVTATWAQVVKTPPTPDQLYGQLFADVQIQKVFPDGKSFVDAIPKRKVADILYDYGMLKGPKFDLTKFINDNFSLPEIPQLNYIQPEKDLGQHVTNLWGVLTRPADFKLETGNVKQSIATGNSIIPLPYPYVVPGGRFREMYYWDSYFTLLGLKASGNIQALEDMVKNFAYLIHTYGHIPNGTRTYYLSRSQPPFFALMVELLASIKGKSIYTEYLPALKKEYDYWMEGGGNLKKETAFKRVVKLADGNLLNRYWDEASTPRPESYVEDRATADQAVNELAMRIRVASPEQLKKMLDNARIEAYQNLRAGAASGWDFSSRWMLNQTELSTTKTTEIIPIDLNCLLYQLEKTLATAYAVKSDKANKLKFTKLAEKRKLSLLKYGWNHARGFFFDYNFKNGSQTEQITAAGIYPLFVKIVTPKQAGNIAAVVEKQLLKPGGLVTTTIASGQQWDAPNGWAPLQWITIVGLKNYQLNFLANTIATRWVNLNEKVYAETGKMMEKYDVEDLSKPAGGGEYPAQDGFGWTNGVYLALKQMLANR